MTGFAFAIVLGVLFVQALPWPDLWKRAKPLSCRVCLVSWSIIGYGFSPWCQTEKLMTALSAGGLALLLLALYDWLKGSALVPPA